MKINGTENQVRYANELINSLAEMAIPSIELTGDYNTDVVRSNYLQAAENAKFMAQMIRCLRDTAEAPEEAMREMIMEASSVEVKVLTVRDCMAKYQVRNPDNDGLDAPTVISALKGHYKKFVDIIERNEIIQ